MMEWASSRERAPKEQSMDEEKGAKRRERRCWTQKRDLATWKILSLNNSGGLERIEVQRRLKNCRSELGLLCGRKYVSSRCTIDFLNIYALLRRQSRHRTRTLLVPAWISGPLSLSPWSSRREQTCNVWYKRSQGPFCVFGGRYTRLYEKASEWCHLGPIFATHYSIIEANPVLLEIVKVTHISINTLRRKWLNSTFTSLNHISAFPG